MPFLRSDNTAEAVEDESELKRRLEEMEKERRDEATMLKSFLWSGQVKDNDNDNAKFGEDVIKAREKLSRLPAIVVGPEEKMRSVTESKRAEELVPTPSGQDSLSGSNVHSDLIQDMDEQEVR